MFPNLDKETFLKRHRFAYTEFWTKTLRSFTFEFISWYTHALIFFNNKLSILCFISK
jgi:hypothetical protein